MLALLPLFAVAKTICVYDALENCSATYDEKVNASLMHEYSFKTLSDKSVVISIQAQEATIDFRTLLKQSFAVTVSGTGASDVTLIVSEKVRARFDTLNLQRISCAFQVEADTGGEGGDESSDTDRLKRKRTVKAAEKWSPKMNTFVARSVTFDSSSALVDFSDVKDVDFDVASLGSCQFSDCEPTQVVAGDAEITRLVFTGESRWRIETNAGTIASVNTDDAVTFDFRGSSFVLEREASAKIVNEEAVVLCSAVTISQTWASAVDRPATIQADGELRTRFDTSVCPFAFKGVEHWVVERPEANSAEQTLILHAPFYVGKKLNVTVEGKPFPLQFKSLVQLEDTVELDIPETWQIGTMDISGREYFGYTFSEGISVSKPLTANFSQSSLTGTVSISANNFTSLPLLHSFAKVDLNQFNVSLANEHKEFINIDKPILCAFTLNNCAQALPPEYEISTHEQRLAVTYYCGDFAEWPQQTCLGVETNVTDLPNDGSSGGLPTTTIIILGVCIATIVISVIGASVYFCFRPKTPRKSRKQKENHYKEELLDQENEEMVKL